MSLPDDEWGYLVGLVKLLRQDLLQTADTAPGLVDPSLDWLGDRLVEAELLIDLVEGPEFRVGYLDWCDGVRTRLEELRAELAGDGS